MSRESIRRVKSSIIISSQLLNRSIRPNVHLVLMTHDLPVLLGQPQAQQSAGLITPLPSGPQGKLMIVGGKPWNDVFVRMLALANGPDSRVLAAGLAKQTNEEPLWQSRFSDAGARQVSFLRASDEPSSALEAVRSADVIWFGGGSQAVLMQELHWLGVVEEIAARHSAGAVIGGTSAGAAVMSRTMIVGDPTDGESLPPLGEGLALWPEVIVDQHFLARGREPRLLAAVQHHPELVGIGIDDSTYVLVAGNEMEVGGSGTVTVLDARWSTVLQRFQLCEGERWLYRTRHSDSGVLSLGCCFSLIAYGSPEYDAECALRHAVLRVPLGMSLYDENLLAERSNLHFGLFGSEQNLVACLQAVRLSATEAKLRQMAVQPTLQGHGLGRQIVQSVEEVLQRDGVRQLTLHARSSVLGFYSRLGYVPMGEEFTEVGIPHQKMFKELLAVSPATIQRTGP